MDRAGRTEKSEYLAVLFHEFKAPLAAISGYARLLERDPAHRVEYASAIRREAGRMARMADEVLLLERLDRGGAGEPMEPVALAEQVRRAFAAAASRWQEKGLRLELRLEEVTARGYPGLLEHVWSNLVDNAVKYSPPGGPVEARLAAREGRARFSIRNRGEPIPEELLPRLFEPFFRAEGGGPGHGLGLAIVRRIVELHGGSVRAESGPEGTRFTVEL